MSAWSNFMSLITPPERVSVNCLSHKDREPLLAFLARDAEGSIYLRSLVHEFGVDPTGSPEHGRFLGGWRRKELVSVLFFGNSRNITTLGEPEDLVPVLEQALEGPDYPRLFVGPARHAPIVRRGFSRSGAQPYLDREQVYYLLTPRTHNPLDAPVRPARREETEVVARAQAAMTEEDLKVPPGQIDMRRLREISEKRIEEGKVWVWMEGDTLLFKTEESARAPDGVLVGGVFTHPDYRGRGLATRGVAAWAGRLFEAGLERMALHVSATNTPAIRAYERAGFQRHSLLRLMLTF
jgi:ribosomal protein S18 acetylase RimI-like enzyme